MSNDTWKGGNGNWNSTGNWSAGVPTASSTAIINAGTAQVTTAFMVQSINIGSLGTVNFADAGPSQVTGALINAGHLQLDAAAGKGGSSLTIGGALNNSGILKVGNRALSAADTVTVSALKNFAGATDGEIDLTGAATVGVTLDVKHAAGFGVAGELIGNVNLSGDALLEFASGAINTIAASSELTLNGKSAFIADAGALTSNSALKALSTIAGALNLRNGASITTTGALSNDDDLFLDNSAGDGGSSLKVIGPLINDRSLEIGNATLSASDKVSVTELINNGVIDLFGHGAFTSSIAASVAVTNNGFIKLHADATTFGSAVVGTGDFSLDTGSTLTFGSIVGSGEMVTFTGGDELKLGSANTFAGTIENFGTGDSVDALTFGAGTKSSFFESNGVGTVELTRGGLVASIAFSGDYTASDFLVTSSNAGTLIKFA